MIEAMDPIVGGREMAADAFGSFLQPEPAAHLVDDAIALMHADGQRQIPELGSQDMLFGPRKQSQTNPVSHPGLPPGNQDSTY